MGVDVLTGPAPWAVDRLGFAVAAELWVRIPTALAAAIGRAISSRDTSRPGTDHAFGDARWPVQYEELAAHLRSIDGASLARPNRVRYQLVVVRNHVLLPWCYGPTGAISMRDARPGRSLGRLARELLQRFGPTGPRPQAAPPLSPEEADERDVAQVSELLGRLDPAPRVLIAGYACTPDHGLLRACLGEAGLGPDGRLDWYHAEDLPLPPPTIPRPRRQHFP